MNQPQQPPVKEASGIHFIGETDPRSLSTVDFDKSQELLFHPSAHPFTYQQQFDANISEYYLESIGMETLGQGFYTTSDRPEAERRSQIKQGGGNTLPIIIPLLPFQARVLDFRERSDPTQNGPVPPSMSSRWLLFFTDYFHQIGRENLPWTITEPEEKYYSYLREVVRLPSIDLRVMLGTVPFPQSPNISNPSWSRVFANFIIREGLDGIIYNEPSVFLPQKTSPIFVFYSLSKIGTYESWHNTVQTTQPQNPS